MLRADRRLSTRQLERDLSAEAARVTDLPVFSCNDATAACAAELIFGEARHYADMLYIFVAWFIAQAGVLPPGSVGIRQMAERFRAE